MPDFELSPRDLATIAQIEEASLPVEAVSGLPPASSLYGNLPIEERPIPARRTTRYNPQTGREEYASAWPGTPVGPLPHPYRLHMANPRAREHFLARGADPMEPQAYDPRGASLRYESLLSDLAPFIDEARRNQQALETIPFVAR